MTMETKLTQVWFDKRLAYTRSVATSSMVGYILGLGDRHLMNILIDESTAELIHIDLGIAFDQGTVLPIPEAVPFRLTRYHTSVHWKYFSNFNKALRYY